MIGGSVNSCLDDQSYATIKGAGKSMSLMLNEWGKRLHLMSLTAGLQKYVCRLKIKHTAGSTVVPPRIGYIRETASCGSSTAALRQQQLQARKGQLRLSQLNSPTAAASGGRSMSRHLAGEQRNSLTFEVHSLSPPQILVGGIREMMASNKWLLRVFLMVISFT